MKPRAMEESIRAYKHTYGDYIAIIVVALFLKFSYFFCAYFIYPVEGKKSISLNYYTYTLNKNDSGWYQGIVENGYPKLSNSREIGYCDSTGQKQSSWAFFPLYPLLVKVLMYIPGITFNGSALIWSYIFSLLCFCLLYYFFRAIEMKRETALLATMIIMLMPNHYYFSVFYTESIFLSFLLLSFIAIRKKKYILLSIASSFLILSRPNGIISFVPLGLYLLEQENILHSIYKIRFRELSIRKILPFISFVPALILFGLYCVYQKANTTEYFAFSIAQQGWCKVTTYPWKSFFIDSTLGIQYNSIYGIVFILLFIILSIRYHMRLSFVILIFFTLFFPLVKGTCGGLSRYCSVLFPFFLYFTMLLSDFISRSTNYKMIWILFFLLIYIAQLYMYSYFLYSHNLSH